MRLHSSSKSPLQRNPFSGHQNETILNTKDQSILIDYNDCFPSGAETVRAEKVGDPLTMSWRLFSLRTHVLHHTTHGEGR